MKLHRENIYRLESVEYLWPVEYEEKSANITWKRCFWVRGKYHPKNLLTIVFNARDRLKY